MKSAAFIVFLLFCVPIFGCKSFTQNISADNYCRVWNQDYAELVEYQRKDLQTHGISTGKNGYLLSDKLLADCKLRVEIGNYIQKVLGGKTDEKDELFASENSKEIVKVVILTWNYYSDGARSEKYNLLAAKGIKEEDVSPFIIELLKKEGLKNKQVDASLFFTLVNRPFSKYKSTIEELLNDAEKSENYLEQFLALVLLNKDSPKNEYAVKLKQISQNPKLAVKAREFADQIVGKIQRKEDLDLNLIDSFEIEMSTNEIPVSPNISDK